ncbi:MAG: hypothetical protein A3J05_00965 [Candidatus Doudnabacteria bacterium RIFCSPLOWO2_02_FULL_48_13]|uniref:Uncharacterized protein n=1 Tax=Candidatus Doudnabacteria bacterium RIFCSPLOWO2_02_FULL_48_13 TaxID=1817845 RepID=A0A1F5Q8X8_9BACT|nr:MAG: hypothetical protein A3J05_00965 [Candidatus Doudnabacteria bacterium RIFCSPLOWO2_02_FULL_48_13]
MSHSSPQQAAGYSGKCWIKNPLQEKRGEKIKNALFCSEEKGRYILGEGFPAKRLRHSGGYPRVDCLTYPCPEKFLI